MLLYSTSSLLTLAGRIGLHYVYKANKVIREETSSIKTKIFMLRTC